MRPDFQVETEFLTDIFHNASLHVSSTCEEIKDGDPDYQRQIYRIISLFKDLPEIKKRSSSILPDLDLENLDLTSKHVVGEDKSFLKGEKSVIIDRLVQTFNNYFHFVNSTVLPAVISLFNRVIYIRKVLGETKENGIPNLVKDQLSYVMNFLYKRICKDVKYWRKRVAEGNACKTVEDQVKLLIYLL